MFDPSRFKALDDEDWTAVSDALEGSEGKGLDAAAVMEKILGTFTKSMDEDVEDLSKCEVHANNLAAVLDKASQKADPDIKEHATNISALCKRTPLPEETTLEGPLHLLASLSAQPMFRVLSGSVGFSAFMKEIHVVNDQLIAQKDAAACQQESEQFFREVREKADLKLFLNTSEDMTAEQMQEVINLMGLIHSKAVQLRHALGESGLKAGGKACEELLQVFSLCLKAVAHRLAGSLAPSAALFLDGEPVDADCPGQQCMSDSHTLALLQMPLKLASEKVRALFTLIPSENELSNVVIGELGLCDALSFCVS